MINGQKEPTSYIEIEKWIEPEVPLEIKSTYDDRPIIKFTVGWGKLEYYIEWIPSPMYISLTKLTEEDIIKLEPYVPKLRELISVTQKHKESVKQMHRLLFEWRVNKTN